MMRHALSIPTDEERTHLRNARHAAWVEVRGFLIFAASVVVLGTLLLMLVD